MARQKVFLLFCLFIVITWGCQPQSPPVKGEPGIGDPYYPNLGNGGYDVEKYNIILNVNPELNTVDGKTIIEAKATEHLTSFNLDFQDLIVDSVAVNGRKAAVSYKEADMVITPSKSLPLGRSFTIEILYHGTPGTVPSQAVPGEVVWFHAEDGTINIFTEPDGASTWFPNNNHPRDKAFYRFEIKVSDPWIVAATGMLKKTIPDGKFTTYIFESDEPMASYLAAINIDKYHYEETKTNNGIVIRSYFPLDYPEKLRNNFAVLPDMVEYLSDLFGPYPFKEYGVVIADPEIAACRWAGADETQTLSIHCSNPEMADERVIVHELAHQWFGDSVSLENWKDLWLKEGMATYVEWLWLTRDKDLDTLNKIVKIQMNTYFPTERIGEPPVDSIYGDEVYKGGALVFHALRLQVGDDAFFQIMRTYLDRYRGSSAGTDEFIVIAEEISGQDLQEFFDSWLRSTQVPKMQLE